MRVLIADDQKEVSEVLAGLVRQCGHEVVELVASGFEAIQSYNRHRPDLVLMDYYMSRLNGATACRNILARNPGALIVLVSGARGVGEPVDFGAVGMLAKPVDLADLAALLDKYSGAPAEVIATK